MKRSLIYNETSYTVYICGIAKGSIGTDLDLSYIVHCLYKNLNPNFLAAMIKTGMFMTKMETPTGRPVKEKIIVARPVRPPAAISFGTANELTETATSAQPSSSTQISALIIFLIIRHTAFLCTSIGRLHVLE